KNKGATNALIADKIKKNIYKPTGNFTKDNKIIVYKVNSVFEDFIPDFDDIKDYVYRMKVGLMQSSTKIDSTVLRKYYEDNSDKFFSKDSLQIGGVFYKFQPDSVIVYEYDILQYYKNKKSDFENEKLYHFDVISYNGDQNYLHSIYEELELGADFSDLKLLVSQDAEISGDIAQLVDLPPIFQETLQSLKPNEYSDVINYNKSTYIVKLNQINKSSQQNIEEATPFIREILKNKYAHEQAFKKIKVIFDSTKYFKDVYKFADSLHIYKTEKQSFDSDFDVFGKLNKYQNNLMVRLKDDEKLSHYIDTEEGYGIVYPLRRLPRQKIKFEEATHLIKQFIKEEKDYQLSTNFFEALKTQIEQGVNADSLLSYIGGWKDFKNSEDDLEQQFIDLIKNDIIKHNSGYISHIMKLQSNDYFFYKINNIEKKQLLNSITGREDIFNKMIDNRFANWKKGYSKKVGVVTFF
ncbi:MAG: peptidylprolyl isomerase, partial [Candidatus Cloacimonadota bacterium]|nr:peptidylprolyl isomerase [Candidatus Cloacimonadota bacterium]